MNTDLQNFIKPFQRHENDNGSSEVQVAVLSYEITLLQTHIESHHQDIDAKRSLLKKVARRRKFMKYLKEIDLERYTFVAKKLKLKA